MVKNLIIRCNLFLNLELHSFIPEEGKLRILLWSWSEMNSSHEWTKRILAHSSQIITTALKTLNPDQQQETCFWQYCEAHA